MSLYAEFKNKKFNRWERMLLVFIPAQVVITDGLFGVGKKKMYFKKLFNKMYVVKEVDCAD